jgi:hypothetical protein
VINVNSPEALVFGKAFLSPVAAFHIPVVPFVRTSPVHVVSIRLAMVANSLWRVRRGVRFFRDLEKEFIWQSRYKGQPERTPLLAKGTFSSKVARRSDTRSSDRGSQNKSEPETYPSLGIWAPQSLPNRRAHNQFSDFS